MIAGALALLALLFGGGSQEIFFFDKFEKAIKQYVAEKPAKKEILADLKNTKKYVEKYNKSRKKKFKEFKNLNASSTSSREDLVHFFDALQEQRKEFQNKVTEDRIAVHDKIGEGEWVAIMEYSEAAASKRFAKEQKKAAKAKDKIAFKKTRKAITQSIPETEKEKLLIKSLDKLIDSFNGMENEIKSVIEKENSVLLRPNANKEELGQLAKEMNELRSESYKYLVDFHMTIKENTNSTEWAKIMKAFNSELVISSR